MRRNPSKRAQAEEMRATRSRADEIGSSREVPLCVDLDGTLIKSDLLFEGLVRCVKYDVLHGLRALWWLRGGKAQLKAEVARRASINVERLPVNHEFLEWIRSESRAGRRVVLCTAADRAIAEQVARRFGIFEEVLASDQSRNLAGRSKAALLAETFGESGFDYAGNEARDRAIWSKARKAIVVAPGLFLRRRLNLVPRVERVFPKPGETVRCALVTGSSVASVGEKPADFRAPHGIA
jgi:hypothetical protein